MRMSDLRFSQGKTNYCQTQTSNNSRDTRIKTLNIPRRIVARAQKKGLRTQKMRNGWFHYSNEQRKKTKERQRTYGITANPPAKF